MKESVCCVICEVKAIDSGVACILQTTVHGATQRVYTHSYGKTLQQRGQFQSQVYRSVRKDGQTEACVKLLAVLPLAYRGAQKINTLMCYRVYLCSNCQLASCLCVCLCGMENRVTLFLWQSFSKLVESSDSGAKHLQRGSFERNF